MAGQPWGNSRYPPFAAPYAPPVPGPSFDPRRAQYQPPPPVGFYNPAVMHAQPTHAPHAPYPPYAGGYAPSSPPAMPQPNVPHILQPGAGPRKPSIPTSTRTNSQELGGNMFFDGPRFPEPQLPSAPPLRHSMSEPAPPVPQRPRVSSPPVLPPKPSRTSPVVPTYPQAGSTPGAYPEAHPTAPIMPPPRHSSHPDRIMEKPLPRPAAEEDEALRAALEQSKRDAEEARRREDEDLARAMAESLTTSPRRTYDTNPFHLHDAPSSHAGPSGSAPVPEQPPSRASAYASPPPFPPQASPLVPSPDALNSEFAKPPEPPMSNYTSSPPTLTQQILDDEALARRLAEEEEELAKRKQHEERVRALANAPPVEGGRPATQPPRPPDYSPALSVPSPSPSVPSPDPASLSAPALLPSLSRQPSPAYPGPVHAFPSQSSPAHPSPPPPEPHLGRSSSASVVSPAPSPIHPPDLRTSRSQSFGAQSSQASPTARPPLPHAASSNYLRTAAPSPQLPAVPEKAESSHSHTSVVSSNSRTSPGMPNGSPGISPPVDVPRASNQFVDSALLRGVTIGFDPPVISAVLTPYKDAIPNVIMLPYERAPPLHIKAPNWRDLLTLMARLSGSRLEPTLEAITVVKTTMHLRVVVNFVKVHASSNDWHVILYLTIDHPIPADHRYKQRNTNDPALLPYSYTLSPTPAFLMEHADGPMSKWYSVPATASNPYPALPISFPDLATYLMSALEESRRASSDRTSGCHRLAKAVDTLYPTRAAASADDDPEERTLSDRFRGLFRGNKNNRPANDDRSNLVTPFFADDYGR